MERPKAICLQSVKLSGSMIAKPEVRGFENSEYLIFVSCVNSVLWMACVVSQLGKVSNESVHEAKVQFLGIIRFCRCLVITVSTTTQQICRLQAYKKAIDCPARLADM